MPCLRDVYGETRASFHGRAASNAHTVIVNGTLTCPGFSDQP
jgi:hypothetical protein